MPYKEPFSYKTTIHIAMTTIRVKNAQNIKTSICNGFPLLGVRLKSPWERLLPVSSVFRPFLQDWVTPRWRGCPFWPSTTTWWWRKLSPSFRLHAESVAIGTVWRGLEHVLLSHWWRERDRPWPTAEVQLFRTQLQWNICPVQECVDKGSYSHFGLPFAQ